MKVRNKLDRALALVGVGEVAAGGEIEVDDDLGARLCEQVDRWEAATTTSKKKPSAPADDVSEED